MLEWVVLILFVLIVFVIFYSIFEVDRLERWYKEREFLINNELKELDITIERYVNPDKNMTTKLVLKYFGRNNNYYGNHYTKPMYMHELASLLQDMEKANYLDVLMPKLIRKDPVPQITFKVKK